ncbi:hypothetical protein L6164_002988 [Bauhinia variegata]|uniref:Uncharacterized protein n=1 Tax=Bauhinia variegata TaxID=167791 RepID=A0ACB9Q003_BAUVA|nr:hypothetical protein L6164_002988 [Bauhinia variegata]
MAVLVTSCHGDIGKATMGGPVSFPTACAYNESQIPSDGLIASAGESVWVGGKACGSKYQLKCTAAISLGACVNETIVVTIVDRALNLTSPLKNGCNLVLPNAVFHKIATQGTELVNLEYTLLQT